MQIEELKWIPDQYAIRSAQGRTHNRRTRNVDYVWFAEESNMSLAEVLKKKAAAMKSGKTAKPSTKVQPTAAKAQKKAAATKKEHTKSTRVQITDENGNIVSGRDNTFKCVECGNEITGPWSYKMHLVKQHDYSRKQAGLREEK